MKMGAYGTLQSWGWRLCLTGESLKVAERLKWKRHSFSEDRKGKSLGF
jgi:hypothetical protein